MRFPGPSKAITLAVFCAGAFVPDAAAQTASDSGWAPLFDGRDLLGLEVQIKGKPKGQDPDKVFSVHDGLLHAYAGWPITDGNSAQGYVVTAKEYSRYRVRLEYRFADRPGTGGSGVEYHVHEGEFWPRCLECQLQRGYAGDCWLINGAGARDAAGRVYAPGGYVQIAKTSRQDKDIEWNSAEVLVMGTDSSVHRINGTVNNRVYQLVQLNGANQAVPLVQGRILVQAEGQEMLVRRWEIQELDAQGRPLNAAVAVRRSAGLAPLREPQGDVLAGWKVFCETLRGRTLPGAAAIPGP
jgi:hypothetical protein